MNKLWIMIQNEAIKMFKRKSTLALVVIMLIGCIAVPIIHQQLSSSVYEYRYGYEEQKENILNNLSHLSDAEADYEKEDKANMEVQLYMVEVMSTAELDRQWEGIVERAFTASLMKAKAIDLIDSGVNKKDMDYFSHVQGIEIDKLYSMTPKERAVEKQYFTGIAQKTEDYIKNKQWGSFFTAEHENLRVQLENKREELKDPGDTLPINIENEIYMLESQMKVCNYVVANNVDMNKSWQSQTLAAIYGEVSDSQSLVFNEEDFTKNIYQHNPVSYDQYYKGEMEYIQSTKDRIQIFWYGLENNIPPMNSDIADAYSDISDVRIEAYRATNPFLSILTGCIILIGAGLIASEYTKKTITSLLIYCPNRMKLVGAKLIFLLLTAIAAAIVGVTLLHTTNGFIFGFKNYFMPVLELVDGNVVEKSFFFLTVSQMSLGFIGLIALGSFTLLLSAVTKNIVVAVTLPLVTLLAAPSVVYKMLQMNQRWIYATFVPYLELHFLEATNRGYARQFYVAGNMSTGIIWMLGITLVSIAGIAWKLHRDDV